MTIVDEIDEITGTDIPRWANVKPLSEQTKKLVPPESVYVKYLKDNGIRVNPRAYGLRRK